MIGINVYQKEEKKLGCFYLRSLRLQEQRTNTKKWEQKKKGSRLVKQASVEKRSEQEETVWDNYYHRGGFPRSIFAILLNCLSKVWLPNPPSFLQHLLSPRLPPGTLLSSFPFFFNFCAFPLSLIQWRKTVPSLWSLLRMSQSYSWQRPHSFSNTGQIKWSINTPLGHFSV